MTRARKISFRDAWNSSTIFFLDEELEQEIDAKVEVLLETAKNHRVSDTVQVSVADIADFLSEKKNGLDVILKDVGLSMTK
ncbi:MAG: hypothetical protein U9Q82_04215 [Chloroflexota bacterium]|nr:hypothetical protein [Chloroflexota bacterium]